MKYAVEFRARGHRNVKATHGSTLEVTKDPYLTPRGDCIVAVASTKAAADLPLELKELLKSEGCRVKLVIEAGGLVDSVMGFGSPKLALTDERSMVFRKSSHVCPRTVMVCADKAAAQLSRKLVEVLRDPSTMVKLRLEAWVEG